jgi:hypothetical protein
MINGIMIGINKIKEGWYKFKNAVGLGDKTENNNLIAQIEADTEARKKAIVDGYAKAASLGVESAKEFIKAGQSLKWNEENTLAGAKDKIMDKLGLGTPPTPTTPEDDPTKTNLNTEGQQTAGNVIAGGKRTTNINVSIGEVGNGVQIYVDKTEKGINDFGRMVREELLRAINSINQMQTA